MGKYSHEEWYLKQKNQYIFEYGEIPPHWIIFPDTHPYSMLWRMGSGETFVMVFSNWFEDNFQDEISKIEFFLKYPAPPRWLEVMATYIWDIEIDIEEGFEQSIFLEKLKKLGFSGTDEYIKDLEDPKWLD
jgi:hypothetical protein